MLRAQERMAAQLVDDIDIARCASKLLDVRGGVTRDVAQLVRVPAGEIFLAFPGCLCRIAIVYIEGAHLKRDVHLISLRWLPIFVIAGIQDDRLLVIVSKPAERLDTILGFPKRERDLFAVRVSIT